MDLSIIIISFNTKDLLSQCLDSIKNSNKTGIKVEAIVVDNASSDGSPDLVEKNYSWVKLIKSPKNLGFSAGNNLGIKKAKGEYILFLNSDTLLEKETLKKTFQFAKSQENLGAVTCKLVLRSGELDPDCHRGFPTPWASLNYFLGLEKLFPKHKLFAGYHQFYKNLNFTHEIDACTGAFMLMPQTVLDKVGQWDEKYFFYGEDIDLCFRIKQKGYKIYFFPNTKTIHYKGASSGLRKETADIAKPDPLIRLKVAQESTKAMKIFYNKFYKDRYPKWLTTVVLSAISIKGYLRVLKANLNNIVPKILMPKKPKT